MAGTEQMIHVGIVVIGRNEGERLVRCLRSLPAGGELVYVDSGSSDGSVIAARQLGAMVVELDMSIPFTAARARNAGRAALSSNCRFIQFLDGDCVLQPGWISVANSHLAQNSSVGAVFGRLREVAPQASRYNWMCDVEWAVAPGEVRACGGNVMMRATALDEAGGYPDAMIAGEEPDLSLRMRGKGWKIVCVGEEMALHDAAITRFGQWWRRAVRSGHAYAELAERHRGSPLQDYDRRLRKVLIWGLVLPLVFVASIAAALVAGRVWLLLPAVVVGMLLLAQIFRLTLRETRQHPLGKAATLGLFLTLAKPAQALGWWRFRLTRMRGGQSTLIEYKRA